MRSPQPNLFDIASDLEGPPKGGQRSAWLYGVLVAAPLVVYGSVCALTQHAWFVNVQLKGVPGPPGFLREWHGQPAIALGTVLIGVGAVAHFHWFWSNSPRLGRYYEIGKLASLVLLIGGLGWWIKAVW